MHIAITLSLCAIGYAAILILQCKTSDLFLGSLVFNILYEDIVVVDF